MHMFVCICTCMNIYVYMQEGWSRYTCTHMHTQMVWHNTNELLKEGYCGIKTGVTPATGSVCHPSLDE